MQHRSNALRNLATGTVARAPREARNVAWFNAGTVKGKTKAGDLVILRRVTPVDCSRYTGPVLQELAKRLPRRLRAA